MSTNSICLKVAWCASLRHHFISGRARRVFVCHKCCPLKLSGSNHTQPYVLSDPITTVFRAEFYPHRSSISLLYKLQNHPSSGIYIYGWPSSPWWGITYQPHLRAIIPGYLKCPSAHPRLPESLVPVLYCSTPNALGAYPLVRHLGRVDSNTWHSPLCNCRSP